MRKRIFQGLVLSILVVSLIMDFRFAAFATGQTEVTETAPAETVPEQTEPKVYTVDKETDIYKACDALAEGMAAKQILVYDSATDTILYSRSVEGEKLYPASITKLFSCYVALQYLDPDEVITAGDELDLVQEGSSMAYIYRKQSVTVKTVVEGMMLPSGNDAAMILAAAAGRRIAGDESLEPEAAVQEFVDEMNRQAESLGFEKSHFANPDGYHVGAHYTSINDMARIAKLALENKTIRRYMGLFEDDVIYASGQSNHWENTNLFLNPEEGFYRSDAIGMKTGRTRQAGYCLMSAFRNGKSTLVIGMFGYEDEYDRFRDTVKILKACKG